MHKLVHFGSYYSPLHYDYIIFHDKIDRPFRFICPINRPAFNEEKEPVGCNGGEVECVETDVKAMYRPSSSKI